MAHLVESMFSVKEKPWHGLGVIVNQAPTTEEAIKLAGLDWQVQEKQIYRMPVENVDFASHVRVPEYKALTRSDNGKTLAVMKETYKPLQNSEAFSFFNPFIESKLASFETAGSLKEGKIVWILATLNKAPIDVGGGDIVNKHLLLSNSHDGTMAVRVGFTPTRVACNNTLTMAHNSEKSTLLRVKHSSKVSERMANIQGIINAYDAKFEATADQYKMLSKKSVNQKDLEKYVSIIFETNENGTDREKIRAKRMKEQIQSLFENGAGQTLKSAKGTAWGMYNSVTEYLTHYAGKDDESRLERNWFGSFQRKNTQAFDLAMEFV